MKNIAKLTSYGCYLDCDFVTAKYPEDETHIVGNVAEYVYDLEQKIAELETKLAEKEKEIEKSHLILDKILTEIHTNCYSGLNIVKFKEMAINDLGGIVNSYNQDKISFAVEQLENVKENILLYISIGIQREWISNKIDNQIKQLKEMK